MYLQLQLNIQFHTNVVVSDMSNKVGHEFLWNFIRQERRNSLSKSVRIFVGLFFLGIIFHTEKINMSLANWYHNQ